MDRFNPWIFSIASAITFATLYTVCALAFALWPDGTLSFFNAWFHGLDLSLLKPAGGARFTVGKFIYGLSGVAATAFLGGLLLALVYNIALRRRES